MDQSERTVQPLSIFRPNVATWRQGVKHVSDALLAGMAWMVAEWLWFEPQRSLINLTLWTVCACVVGSIFHLTSPSISAGGIRDIIRIGFGTVTLMLLALALKFLPLGQAGGTGVLERGHLREPAHRHGLGHPADRPALLFGLPLQGRDPLAQAGGDPRRTCWWARAPRVPW